jgi:hypothetical protein
METPTKIFDSNCWPSGGGFLSVLLFRSSTATYQMDNDGVVTVITASPVWELPIFPDSIELKELDKDGNGGWYLDTSIQFTTLNRPEVRSWRSHIRFDELNALVTKPDGTQLVIGTKETPLLLTADANDGVKFADRQKMDFKLMGQQLAYSRIYLPE